jgi:hypothetical protein
MYHYNIKKEVHLESLQYDINNEIISYYRYQNGRREYVGYDNVLEDRYYDVRQIR